MDRVEFFGVFIVINLNDLDKPKIEKDYIGILGLQIKHILFF